MVSGFMFSFLQQQNKCFAINSLYRRFTGWPLTSPPPLPLGGPHIAPPLPPWRPINPTPLPALNPFSRTNPFRHPLTFLPFYFPLSVTSSLQSLHLSSLSTYFPYQLLSPFFNFHLYHSYLTYFLYHLLFPFFTFFSPSFHLLCLSFTSFQPSLHFPPPLL